MLTLSFNGSSPATTREEPGFRVFRRTKANRHSRPSRSRNFPSYKRFTDPRMGRAQRSSKLEPFIPGTMPRCIYFVPSFADHGYAVLFSYTASTRSAAIIMHMTHGHMITESVGRTIFYPTKYKRRESGYMGIIRTSPSKYQKLE